MHAFAATSINNHVMTFLVAEFLMLAQLPQELGDMPRIQSCAGLALTGSTYRQSHDNLLLSPALWCLDD